MVRRLSRRRDVPRSNRFQFHPWSVVKPGGNAALTGVRHRTSPSRSSASVFPGRSPRSKRPPAREHARTGRHLVSFDDVSTGRRLQPVGDILVGAGRLRGRADVLSASTQVRRRGEQSLGGLGDVGARGGVGEDELGVSGVDARRPEVRDLVVAHGGEHHTDARSDRTGRDRLPPQLVSRRRIRGPPRAAFDRGPTRCRPRAPRRPTADRRGPARC